MRLYYTEYGEQQCTERSPQITGYEVSWIVGLSFSSRDTCLSAKGYGLICLTLRGSVLQDQITIFLYG